jgi:hypothetical protein
VPLSAGAPRESTLAVWRTQGLPPEADWYDYLLQVLGIALSPKQPRLHAGVSCAMIPTFEEYLHAVGF